MSYEQAVIRRSTDLDNGFNASYECGFIATLQTKMFTQFERGRMVINTNPWGKAKVQVVQFLIGRFDGPLRQWMRHYGMVRLMSGECRSFFVGKETAQKFGGKPIVTGGK
jgi:hypothetical protein|tara:strand:+ start:1762 stop:2091 length:330 start_codon:yes stop_codon:yes gene_type:complete